MVFFYSFNYPNLPELSIKVLSLTRADLAHKTLELCFWLLAAQVKAGLFPMNLAQIYLNFTQYQNK